MSDFSSRYEIRREIGRGGMGKVTLAFDHFEQREVAIKSIRKTHFEEADRGQKIERMWMNESRLAGRLNHPNIAKIYETGTTRNHCYLIMEYILGRTLKEHTDPDRLLPFDNVIDILYKIGNALEYAQQLGLLHRDIKPANILISTGGAPKLVDFGSVYVLNSEITQVNNVGTLPYMAPEQFSDTPPGVQMDIYALGVTAYQLLCGALPYSGSTTEAVIYQKLNNDFVPIELRRPNIPSHLRSVVQRALFAERDIRHVTWREFCEDLAMALPSLRQTRPANLDSARFDRLRDLAFFKEFSHVELWEIVHIGLWHTKHLGARLVDQGGRGNSVFVIVEGEAKVLRHGTELNRIGTGDCIGELAYIDTENNLHTATVVAITPMVVLEIPNAAMSEASDGLQTRWARSLMRQLAARLTQTGERYLAVMAAETVNSAG